METGYKIIILFISHITLALLAHCSKSQAENSSAEHQESNSTSYNNQDYKANDGLPHDYVPPFPDVRSPPYLLELAQYETTVITVLGNLEANFSHLLSKEVLQKINTYQNEYSEEILRAEQYSNVTPSAVLVAENPILEFNMICRFENELPEIRLLLEPFHSMIEDEAAKEFIGGIKTSNWPSRKSFEEAMIGLLRIQMFYDLDPRELYSGIIYGVKTGAWLKIEQVQVLAEFTRELKQYTLSIPWFELAIELLQEPEYEQLRDASLPRIQTMLRETMEQHDAEWADHGSAEYYFYLDKLIVDGEVDPDRIPTRQLDFSEHQRLDAGSNEVNSWSLCNGSNHQTEAEKADLSCWYDFSAPYLYVNPNKIELLSDDPYIIQMYDVISESTSKRIMEIAPLTSVFVPTNDTDTERAGFIYKSYDCTSLGGYVVEEDEKLTKLSKFIEASTGFTVVPATASQKYLVISYAYGGHYGCHLDARDTESMTPADDVTGNRIATMTFYLNDVQSGGYTVFPQAGVAGRPIKGSALFWYNLKKNGLKDENSYHCACPVVLGHKTIASKWVNHHDQFLNHPCGLSIEE